MFEPRVIGSALAALAAACTGLTAGAADVPVSTRPPGGLAPAQTPQLVLLTFDDTVSTASLARVRQVVSGRTNPNGQAIKATFFVSFGSGFDPYAIRQLYDAGHEIAVHTMSHATSELSDVGRWRQEIAGARRVLDTLSGIPPGEVVGFRAPFLKPNDALFQVLVERGFVYDASFRESLSGLSTAATNMIWPYTLDRGLQQVATAGYAPATNYPGFFEVPLWTHLTNTSSAFTMDPPDGLSTAEVVELWRTNFLAHYLGNRAPYGLFLHASSSDQWLSEPAYSEERLAALGSFIDWVRTFPDTWFVSCRDLVAFMLDPVEGAGAAAHPAFQTPARTPFPTSSLVRCSYPGSHSFLACGECPLASPAYTNAYLGRVPLGGGVLQLNIVSQSAAYAWGVLVLTNDTPRRLYDWSASFTLAGGTLQGLYDAVWTQVVDQVSLLPRSYSIQLAPGAARVMTFRVTRSGGDVAFDDVWLDAAGLGPQPIWLDLRQSGAPPGWLLSWTDSAYVYGVERSTNLLDAQGWSAVTNGLCAPALQLPPATDGAPRFFRVSGVLY